jgi:phosphate:Na+ symporter
MRSGATVCVALLVIFLLPQGPRAQENPRTGLIISKASDTFGRDISGDGQLGTAGAAVLRPIVVSVVDSSGTPLSGIPVLFRVFAEPGENVLTGKHANLTPGTGLTDEYGYAKTQVRLGGEPGEYHLVASINGHGPYVTFAIKGMPKGWPFFVLFGLVGGLSLFLFGLSYVGRALSTAAGGRLRHMTFSLSEKRHIGIFVGALLALLVQSSSAAVTMLMGFANTGLLSLSQSLGLVLGADIGTTITVQVIASKVTNVAPLLIALGFLLMAFRQRHPGYVGRAVFGVGMVFLGLRLMSDSVLPFQTNPVFKAAAAALAARPFLTLIVAAVFAMAVRSGAGPIGVAITLAYGGMIELRAALAVVLGANLGSALTALLASVRSTTEGRRVAVAHMLFKSVVVIIFLGLIRQFATVVEAAGGSVARQIANAHTILNVAAVVVFFPLLGRVERLVGRLVREGPDSLERRPKYLDETALGTPSLALGQAQREVMRTADIVAAMFMKVKDVLRTNDEALRTEIVAEDDKVDDLSRKTTTYLTKISQEELTEEQSLREVALLHIVDELESIGDVVSKSLMVYAEKKIRRGFYFSKEGFSEINEFHSFVCETLTMAVASFSSWDKRLARQTVARRKEGAGRLAHLHAAHIDRLRREKPESLDTSSVHLDLIRDLERVNFHASNIAEAVLGRISYEESRVSRPK